MKAKIIFAALLISIFCNSTLKAQDGDDPVCGLYVDGVKVTELTCYSFGTLTIVFPYNPAYANYDKIALNFYDGGDPAKGRSSHHSSREIPVASLFKYTKGKYMVYEIISKDKQNLNAEDPTGIDPYGKYLVTRGSMMYYSTGMVLGEGEKEEIFYAGVTALKANGEFVEGYNANGQYYRYPKWDIENLYSTQIKLSNRQKLKIGLLSAETPNNKQIDLTQPCTYPGTKFDFRTLENTSAAAKAKKTEESETTDVSTLPYTEKYSSGKLKVQGQKNADGLQEGTWKYLDEAGKLIRTESYSNGMANGTWKYYKDGKVIKTETYKDGEKSE